MAMGRRTSPSSGSTWASFSAPSSASPGSVIIDLHTNTILNLYFATAAPNGSTLLLPALASDLGLAKSDDRNFTYTVESFTVVRRCPADGQHGPTKPGHFNAFRPVLSNGDFVALDPGASTSLR